MKYVKLFKKFGQGTTAPSVVLELVFLVNIPVMLIAILFLRFIKILDIGWVNVLVCGLYYGGRLTILGDLCLNYLDKFVALYWSEHYKASVTSTKAALSCLVSKSFCLLLTIITVTVFRFLS